MPTDALAYVLTFGAGVFVGAVVVVAVALVAGGNRYDDDREEYARGRYRPGGGLGQGQDGN